MEKPKSGSHNSFNCRLLSPPPGGSGQLGHLTTIRLWVPFLALDLSVWSLRVLTVSLWVLFRFFTVLPQSKNMQIRYIGSFKSAVGDKDFMVVYLSSKMSKQNVSVFDSSP